MIKKCVICGEEFESRQSKAKYCGIVCRMEANRIRSRWNEKLLKRRNTVLGEGWVVMDLRKKCVYCGNGFKTSAHNRKYCDDCRKLYRSKKLYPRHEKPAKEMIQPEGTVNCTKNIVKSCRYSIRCGGFQVCNYIGIVGRSRRCPPNACDKYEPVTDRKRQQAENRKKILNNIVG